MSRTRDSWLFGCSIAMVLGLTTVVLGQGSSEVIALTGDTIPDGTATLTDVNPFTHLNDKGQVAYSSELSDVNHQVIVLGGQGQSKQIARTGEIVPGGNGTFDIFGLSLGGLNNQGQVAFGGSLAGTSGGSSDNEAIYVGDGSQTNEIARLGSLLPPTSPPMFSGLEYGDLRLPAGSSIINDGGQVVFRSAIDGLSPFDDTALFVSHPTDAYTVVAQEGDSAPGNSGPLGIYHRFDVVGFFDNVVASINDAGETGFHASTRSPDGHGVFWNSGSAQTGSLSAARTGQSNIPGAPGTIDLAPTIGGFSGDPSDLDMNENGELVFQAQLNELPGGPPNDTALLRFSPDEAMQTGDHGLTTIARFGQPVPDGNGTLGVPTFFGFQMNNHGEVSFASQIISDDFGLADNGIFRSDGQSMDLIARKGQQAPDGLRKYRDLRQTAINDAGQVAFSSSLTDANGDFAGTGLFIGDGIETLQIVRDGQPLLGSTVDSVTFASTDGINELGQVAYGVTLADGRDAILLHTLEDIHWRSAADGMWDESSNWTLSTQPGFVHNVSIDPVDGVLVSGPSQPTIVKDLRIGSTTTGVAELQLQNSGPLRVAEGLLVDERGRLSGNGAITGDVEVASEGEVFIGIDGLTDHGQFAINGTAMLGGTLAIQTLGGSYLDPTAPGSFDAFNLISASLITGVFDEIEYDGLALEPTFGVGIDGSFATHVGDGLFRLINYSDDVVALANYAALPGDANADGVVDGLDFIIWNDHKFTTGTDWTTGDFNGDGLTDGLDYVVWNANKFTSIQDNVVPEPSGLGLMLTLTSAVMVGRLRQSRQPVRS